MKRSLLCMLALLLSVTLLLSGCSGDLIELTYDKETGAYVGDDVAYLHAPANYEAVGLRDYAPYAEISGKKPITLYEIDDADPARLLADQYFYLYYAKGTNLPALWEMQVNKVYVAEIKADAEIEFSYVVIENAEDIAALILHYRRGNSVSFDESALEMTPTLVGNYRLRFASDVYPSFYYCLEYREYDEDVVIYELIDSKEGFVPTYSGTVSTSFDERYVSTLGQLYAVYNFGKTVLRDPDTGRIFAAKDMIAKHLTE